MKWAPLALALLLACGRPRATPAPRADRPPHSPRSRAEFGTTDGGIAAGNLDGEIEFLERARAQGRADGPTLGSLVERLLLRAQFLGRLDDYERAEQTAAQMVGALPGDPQSYLERSRVRSALHRFPHALADLDEATRRGADAGQVDRGRAGVLQATGRYDEALPIRRRIARASPGLEAIGAEATLLAERGDFDAAAARFLAAQEAYRDVWPFPLCWLYYQEGRMWERAGDLERARELMQAARDRLPRYAAAASHLAWLEALLGHRAHSLALLREVVASTDDPEPLGMLARLLRDSGSGDEAALDRAKAAQRYEILLRDHPEAFAEHAAAFWLGAGGDPAKALDLARRNLAVRPTPAAYALVAQAAEAAGAPALACQAADGALRFGHPTPPARALAERALVERIHARCAVGSSTATLATPSARR